MTLILRNIYDTNFYTPESILFILLHDKYSFHILRSGRTHSGYTNVLGYIEIILFRKLNVKIATSVVA